MKTLLLMLLACGRSFAATPAPAAPVSLTLPTRYLSVPLHAEVHLPSAYSTAPNQRFPVCLLLHGGGGSAAGLRNLGLAGLATRFGIIIVAPDAGPALFVDPPDSRGAGLESAILMALLPELDRRYRTLGGPQSRMVVGISMSGYAAVHFGLRQPGSFGLIVSLSGALEVPRWSAVEESFIPAAMRKQVDQAFGPVGSECRREKDLFSLVGNLSPEARKSLPFFRLDCGTEDPFLLANQRFTALLKNLEIPHELRTAPGRHDANFWGRQLEEVLSSHHQSVRGD